MATASGESECPPSPSLALWDALRDALDRAGRDPGVRALVLTGGCSGVDVRDADSARTTDMDMEFIFNYRVRCAGRTRRR